MDRHGRTHDTILVAEQHLVGFGPVRCRPYRRQDFPVVDPHSAFPVIPFSRKWRQVHFRTAVVLKLYPGAYILCFRRVDPGPGIRRVVLLRLFVDPWNKRPPDMAEVDACAGRILCLIRLVFVCIVGFQLLFGRE